MSGNAFAFALTNAAQERCTLLVSLATHFLVPPAAHFRNEENQAGPSSLSRQPKTNSLFSPTCLERPPSWSAARVGDTNVVSVANCAPCLNVKLHKDHPTSGLLMQGGAGEGAIAFFFFDDTPERETSVPSHMKTTHAAVPAPHGVKLVCLRAVVPAKRDPHLNHQACSTLFLKIDFSQRAWASWDTKDCASVERTHFHTRHHLTLTCLPTNSGLLGLW